MTRVKICGHTSVEDVRASAAAGADAIGVIADVPVDTPREVSPTQASALLDAVPTFVTGVLVTMPETPERTVELAEATSPDTVQLHGDVPQGDLAYLRSKLDTRLLVSVDADDPDRVDTAAEFADAVLVDSHDNQGAGGTGKTHDWTKTRTLVEQSGTPVVLAGGLTPENVGAAIEQVQPYGVDVASGVEATGGQKDHDAVEAFVRNTTRSAQQIPR